VDQLIDRLRKYGAGESAPKPGEPMPGFVLPDENGDRVSLDDLLDEGPVAITFHRGHWFPYCRININALAQVTLFECPSGSDPPDRTSPRHERHHQLLVAQYLPIRPRTAAPQIARGYRAPLEGEMSNG
jgi:hypothetical protein